MNSLIQLGPSSFFSKRDAGVSVASPEVKDLAVSPSVRGNNLIALDTAQNERLDTPPSRLPSGKEDSVNAHHQSSRKRKRGSERSAPEDQYLERLARNGNGPLPSKIKLINGGMTEASVDPMQETVSIPPSNNGTRLVSEGSGIGEDEESSMESDNSESNFRPEHEELQKSSRTVFLANVSTSAIGSKSERKALTNHLTSFKAATKDDRSQCSVVSLRFRSTPYADSKLPRKAAFVKRALMDSTAKSTHAYAVYDSSKSAREAVRHLNGTVVLGRHLRVDSVAHPTAQDHRRCVFVGNIGFVDDETAIRNADGGSDARQSSKSKSSADYEEGLWRTFGQCGKLENVRLVRAQTNQVGKGFAYVQFEDANAVEKALLFDGKKFPPLLPRKLRVLRAKKVLSKADKTKRDDIASRSQGSRKNGRPGDTNMGRASKLYGRASAAQRRRGIPSSRIVDTPPAIFEGHRATSNPTFSKGKKLVRKKNGRSQRAANFKRQRLRQQS